MGCSLLFSANMARLLPYLVTTRWHTSLKETNFHQISYSRVNFSSMMYYSPWKEDVVDLTAAIWMVHVINFNSSQPVHEKNTAFRSNFACAAALPSLLAVNSLIGQCGWVSPSDRGKEGRPINGIIPQKSICKPQAAPELHHFKGSSHLCSLVSWKLFHRGCPFEGATHWWQRSCAKRWKPWQTYLIYTITYMCYVYNNNNNMQLVYLHIKTCSAHCLTWRWTGSPCSILCTDPFHEPAKSKHGQKASSRFSRFSCNGRLIGMLRIPCDKSSTCMVESVETFLWNKKSPIFPHLPLGEAALDCCREGCRDWEVSDDGRCHQYSATTVLSETWNLNITWAWKITYMFWKVDG